MGSDGELLPDAPPWFGRTVIRSVAKLDYGTAQRCMDGTISAQAARDDDAWSGRDGGGGGRGTAAACIPEELWEHARRPVLLVRAPELARSHAHAHPRELAHDAAPAVGCAAVHSDLLTLHRIAIARRRKRFAAGALALTRAKITIAVDGDGNPVGVGTYAVRDSNRVVEEYMLLANYLVAEALRGADAVGGAAVLRRHPPMDPSRCIGAVALARASGFPAFSAASSGALHNSLLAAHAADARLGRALEHLVTLPLKQAEYFVAGSLPPAHAAHYALAIPAYTHVSKTPPPSVCALLLERAL